MDGFYGAVEGGGEMTQAEALTDELRAAESTLAKMKLDLEANEMTGDEWREKSAAYMRQNHKVVGLMKSRQVALNHEAFKRRRHGR
jgi:hypothetical protein